MQHSLFFTHSHKRLAELWPLIALLLLVMFVLIPAVPTLYVTPDTDTSIFMYIGKKIIQGQLPFRDLYDHKPPLIFYLNALGFWLGHGSRWGIWVIELISLSAASLFGFYFLRRFFGGLTALVALAAFLVNLVFVHQRGNLTEEYALPFQFAALFFLSGIERSGRTGWRAFLIGCMLGMASSLKQPMAGAGVAIGAYLLLRYVLEQRWRNLLLAFLFIGIGFLAVWAAWFLYFAAVGIFPEFWEAAFRYNVALSGITLSKRLGALLSAFSLLFSFSTYYLVAMLAWVAVLPALLLKLDSLRIGSWKTAVSSAQFLPLFVALVDLPVELVLSSLSGNNFQHYFMALFPALTILIAYLIDALFHLFDRAAGKMMPYLWVLIFLIPVFGPGMYTTLDAIGPRGDRQIEQVAAYVEANTSVSDPIYQWGIVPSVYLMTGRDSPTRFFFPDPLFVDGYSGREQTRPLLHDLQANPPVLIIDEGIPRLPLLTAPDPEHCESVKDPQVYQRFTHEWAGKVVYDLPQMPEGMAEVYVWICQNYRPVGPVGELNWQVYRLRGK
jgi:4-amino-4-deoxy-L-arabinose transferase-like glycosyltransferase